MMSTSAQLLETIARFTGEDVTAFRQSLDTSKPKAQEVAQHLKSQNVLATGISVAAEIEYNSLSGHHQDRHVIIRRVLKSNNEFFVDAFCQEIKAPRLIKLSSILKITDKTGKVYENAFDFFENVLGIKLQKSTETIPSSAPQYQLSSSMEKGEMKTAIDRTRNELTALLFVAAMDGHKDRVEYDKMAQYVHKRCPDLTFNNDDLIQYLTLINPDTQSFYLSLEKILGMDGWVVKMFLEALMTMIMSDGEVHEKEKLFLAELFRILEEEGFKIEF